MTWLLLLLVPGLDGHQSDSSGSDVGADDGRHLGGHEYGGQGIDAQDGDEAGLEAGQAAAALQVLDGVQRFCSAAIIPDRPSFVNGLDRLSALSLRKNWT